MVDVMDVEIAVATTAEPEETVKTRNLPEQFVRLTGPLL